MDRQSVLPSIPLPTNSVDIGGTTVSIRSLSRAETIKVTTEYKNDIDGAEIFILSCGVGVSLEEAAEWRASTDPISAGKVIDGIIYLTGLSNDPKS